MKARFMKPTIIPPAVYPELNMRFISRASDINNSIPALQKYTTALGLSPCRFGGRPEIRLGLRDID
jgi:hypothetical protein